MAAKGKGSSQQIKITQVKSEAGADKRTKAVLQALGLKRIGTERTYTSNPAVLGQIARVAHLVKIEEL